MQAQLLLKMHKEKGFATLEIILVMLIISALAGVILPKMAKIVDVATLDYEVKKFRSEFLFARSLGRSASYEPSIFLPSPISKGNQITFKTEGTNYRIEQSGNLIREKNFLPTEFKILVPNNLREIKFNSAGKVIGGKTGTYTFTSSLGKKRNLVLDSVGRLQIDENN